ncbi:MAG: hypothetical protein ACK5PR_01765 [bacterium]|jgi:hypothetical protein
MRVIDGEKLNRLVALMERWIENGRNRNAGMLAKLTGINVQTVRRILQKENSPELGTALCILNIVASPEESLDVLSESDVLIDFVKKIQFVTGRDDADSKSVSAQLYNRERFWVYMLALTVKVDKEKIEKMCGAHGVYEMLQMAEEGLIYEISPGEYIPSANVEGVVIENREIYSKAVCYIPEYAATKDNAQKLFMVFNVTKEAFDTIKQKTYKNYSECIDVAKQSPGDVVVAMSVVNTTVLGE